MLYKPNFCCHCGEKIERLEWSPFTSRRFCELCETEKKPYDLLPRAIVAVGILFGIFGFAGLVRDSPKPGIVDAKVEHSASPKRALKSITPGVRTEGKSETANIENPDRLIGQDLNSANAANVENEKLKQRGNTAKTSTQAAYFCNAMTKKGTPCTRRVKNKGRCWQHLGLPAADQPE